MSTKLEQFNEALQYCNECPRGIKEGGWGQGRLIMFIGQSPAMRSEGITPGQSEFDKFFLDLIAEAEISQRDFYFTNLIKTPVYIEEVTERQFMHGISHLIQEVQLIRPAIVIALGRHAQRWVSSDHVGRRVYSIMHPGSIKYGSISRKEWVAKLERIIHYYHAKNTR